MKTRPLPPRGSLIFWGHTMASFVLYTHGLDGKIRYVMESDRSQYRLTKCRMGAYRINTLPSASLMMLKKRIEDQIGIKMYLSTIIGPIRSTMKVATPENTSLYATFYKEEL